MAIINIILLVLISEFITSVGVDLVFIFKLKSNDNVQMFFEFVSEVMIYVTLNNEVHIEEHSNFGTLV